ncbi:MAG: phosphoadenylyl-sulfate reductase [Acidimicrobiales bacterium]
MLPSAATPVLVRPRPALSAEEVAVHDRRLARSGADEIIDWAATTFGSALCVTTSFADTLLVDLATRVIPDIEVVFLDTGFHFAETLATLRRAMERHELNLTVLRPDRDGVDRWRGGVDACCRDRKVALLERHLVRRAGAWMSGLRREDSPTRAHTPVVELDRRGLVKINPIAAWTDLDVETYRREHDVIVNPLLARGYSSVGCWPCTVPDRAGESRSGRWAGSDKTECGLHG